MSDDAASSSAVMAEDTPTAHPTMGGKSLAALERPRYKSWRKKYRKMHADFNVHYETNRTLFKDAQRLEALAKRLREEINGLLEICVDLNQNPSIPPELRFNVDQPEPRERVSTGDQWIPDDLTPEIANARFIDYQRAMRQGTIPPLDLAEVRAQVDAKLAKQGVRDMETMGKTMSQPEGSAREAGNVDEELNFMTFEQEMEYLARMDAKLSGAGGVFGIGQRDVAEQDRHYADLTPRELERKTEFDNPQSQHNWLRTHTKAGVGTEGDGDDTESLASHDQGATNGTGNSGGSTRKRKPAGKGSLAKQVGDRAVERAREGSTAAYSNDEDELAGVSDAGLGLTVPGSTGSRKRQKDPDGAYRLKGSSKAKGKRKRSGEDIVAGGGGKKAKVEGSSGAGTPVAGSAAAP